MSRSARVRRPMGVQFSASSVLACFTRLLASAAVSLTLALLSGCDSGDTGAGGGGAGGAGGGGAGGCLREPMPTFTLKVLAQNGGPVPPDTTILVHWSAGDEPPFHLDDPTTWSTLDISNITCDVDADAPPPADLTVLACALWTMSPTEVTVSAEGHITEQHTYTAEPGADCNAEPTPIEIELAVDHE